MDTYCSCFAALGTWIRCSCFAACTCYLCEPETWDIADECEAAARAEDWAALGQCALHPDGLRPAARYITDENCREIFTSWAALGLAGRVFRALAEDAPAEKLEAVRVFAAGIDWKDLVSFLRHAKPGPKKDRAVAAAADGMRQQTHEATVARALIGHGHADLARRRAARLGIDFGDLQAAVLRQLTARKGADGVADDAVERHLAESGAVERCPASIELYLALADDGWCLLAAEAVPFAAAGAARYFAARGRDPAAEVCRAMLLSVLSAAHYERAFAGAAWLALARFKPRFRRAFGDPDLGAFLRDHFPPGLGDCPGTAVERWRFCCDNPSCGLRVAIAAVNRFIVLTPGELGDLVVRIAGGGWRPEPRLGGLWAEVYSGKVEAVHEAVAALGARAGRRVPTDDIAALVRGYL